MSAAPRLPGVPRSRAGRLKYDRAETAALRRQQGRCRRCGRKLKGPAALRAGYGRVCLAKVRAAAATAILPLPLGA